MRQHNETTRRNDRRNLILQLPGLFLAVVAFWLPRWQQPSQQPQGRDVTVGGTLDHGVRGAGEPQIVQLRPAAIDGGGMVSASLTVAYANPGQAPQA